MEPNKKFLIVLERPSTGSVLRLNEPAPSREIAERNVLERHIGWQLAKQNA